MKILIACDSFKGCLTSRQVSQQIEKGIHQYDETIETKRYSIADGGEGTVEAFCEACQGKKVYVKTTDAYGKKIETYYTIIENGQTAVLEVANIIGLNMHTREERSPFFGSSFGVGTVLLDALQRGCRKIIIGLGGSATNDGGIGFLQALGARFYDSDHKYLSPIAMNLGKVRYIDLNRLQKLEGIQLIAACDVKNYLLGEEGATYVFGKQKGLYPNQMKKLDAGMKNYCDQFMRYIHLDLNTIEGGGAAGGIAAVLIGVLKATMVPGIQLLLQYSDIEKEMQTCDLVITGEGQSDRQTLFGKVPYGILQVAKQYEKPVICISGALGLGYDALFEEGFVGVFSIADRAMTFQQALELAPQKLEASTYNIIRTIMYFKEH